MRELKMHHGCGIYIGVFFLVMFVGILFDEGSYFYNITIDIGAAWMLLFLPFMVIWYLLVKRSRQQFAYNPPLPYQNYPPNSTSPNLSAQNPAHIETKQIPNSNLYLSIVQSEKKTEIICISCGATNLPDQNYCKFCGNHL
jgi:ribosomal protein L40E